ncbi:alpha/beta hydrolase-fold protein [Streptosporangium canum]|uniref:alpha/beta hydrolase-fold protein n=1 Tax=Streptosporangium canum TaxID=324952 RepID=UPI0034475B7B
MYGSRADRRRGGAAAGAVPPLTAPLPEPGTPGDRARDLTCDDRFLSFLAGELPIGEHPASRTVVAGQSLGGPAARHAAYCRTDRFGAAVSQSGSFWWPNEPAEPAEPSGPDGPAREWLTGELAAAARVPARCIAEPVPMAAGPTSRAASRTASGSAVDGCGRMQATRNPRLAGCTPFALKGLYVWDRPSVSPWDVQRAFQGVDGAPVRSLPGAPG